MGGTGVTGRISEGHLGGRRELMLHTFMQTARMIDEAEVVHRGPICRRKVHTDRGETLPGRLDLT